MQFEPQQAHVSTTNQSQKDIQQNLRNKLINGKYLELKISLNKPNAIATLQALQLLIRKNKIPYLMPIQRGEKYPTDRSYSYYYKFYENSERMSSCLKDIKYKHILQLLLGFAQLHKLSITHRDIKQINILAIRDNKQSELKLMLIDFGEICKFHYQQDIRDLRKHSAYKGKYIPKIQHPKQEYKNSIMEIEVTIKQNQYLPIQIKQNNDSMIQTQKNYHLRVATFCKGVLQDLKRFLKSFACKLVQIDKKQKEEGYKIIIDSENFVFFATKSSTEKNKQNFFGKILEAFSTVNTHYIALIIIREIFNLEKLSQQDLRQIFYAQLTITDQRALNISQDLLYLQIYLQRLLGKHYLKELLSCIFSYRISKNEVKRNQILQILQQMTKDVTNMQQNQRMKIKSGYQIWFHMLWIFLGQVQFLKQAAFFKKQYFFINYDVKYFQQYFESWEKVEKYFQQKRKKIKGQLRNNNTSSLLV